MGLTNVLGANKECRTSKSEVLLWAVEAQEVEHWEIGGLIPDPCSERAEVYLGQPLNTKLPLKA